MDYFTRLFQSIVFQTVISGVLVFVIGEIVQKFIIQPIYKHKGIIGEIDNKLKFYANIIATPGVCSKEKESKCSNELRQLSCDLESSYKQLLFKCKNKSAKISNSAKNLIGLSNGLDKPGNPNFNNATLVEQIRKDLDIPIL